MPPTFTSGVSLVFLDSGVRYLCVLPPPGSLVPFFWGSVIATPPWSSFLYSKRPHTSGPNLALFVFVFVLSSKKMGFILNFFNSFFLKRSRFTTWVSCVQQSDSLVHIHTSIYFWILQHYSSLEETEYSAPCYTVGRCCLSILRTIMCI